MTPYRCSDGATLNRLPDQGRNACVASAIGVPMQGPIGQIQDALIDPTPGGRRERHPTALLHAPTPRGPRSRAHSTPIARAAGGSGLVQPVFRSPARIPEAESMR
jgi:hypothetical protein